MHVPVVMDPSALRWTSTCLKLGFCVPLLRHGVTLHMLLDGARQPIPDVPAIYFVLASDPAVRRIVQDAGAGLYDTLHLNFASNIPR